MATCGIWHRSTCSRSRHALAELRGKVTARDDGQDPPFRAEVAQALPHLGIDARAAAPQRKTP
ncbi:hypothetical protein [Paracoccus sp. (in: a-proteobacteria)]|uniref:hypothetical protein n=1 Tax=Paracoccus sp. TaxID=267 RepID=UPI00396C8189